ncbi:MAG: rhodanese-like domain-containing protein [Candidatus Thermoplasmatota archaeon]|jgi:rhodanese-related sulfurtransferase|nr:rhodanese-like domain-containing protein [Candidatus Thermoplasmatota archaeon]MCL5793544.1 rhodanese-like domain-containing protein [Candidatus Thermoplasmatota archaeon]
MGTKNDGSVRILTPLEVADLMNEKGEENVLFLDVREPWEFESNTGHVKGSVLIPMMDIPDRLDELRKHRDKEIAVICNSGHRSYYACQYLMDNGITNVFSIDGGIQKWLRTGMETEYSE